MKNSEAFLPLIEHYLSLQGEGLRAGERTYFVRFARCNLRCRWCDSAYTFGAGKKTRQKSVTDAIERARVRYVCLTGGEPLLYADLCAGLMRKLARHHFDVETGGSLSVQSVLLPNASIIMDWKLPDSHMHEKMLETNLKLLRPQQDLVKLVTTFSPAEKKAMRDFIRRTEKFGWPIAVQSVDGRRAAEVAEWVRDGRNPRVRFSLQLHKILWPKKARGV